MHCFLEPCVYLLCVKAKVLGNRMKVGVIHHSLNIPGGAEKLCLTVIEALRMEGHKVTLITVEKTDWNLLAHNFGRVTKPDAESYLTKLKFSRRLSSLPIAFPYFIAHVFQLLLNKSKRKHKILINTFGDVVNSCADITYIHFPLKGALEFSQVPAFTSNSTWRAVAPVYGSTLSCLERIPSRELLTNSRFMQNIIEKVLSRKPLVVYPPVDVKDLASQYFRRQKIGNIVVTISSYTPKRRLEQIPYIAKHSKSAKFIIMGKADDYSLLTLRRLRELAKKLNVENRVMLQTNVPRDIFLQTLSKAKAYLHVMPYDHFGISVVEAMAAGCVPVVHRSGGPWLDILDAQQGKYGFSYTSIEAAANAIDTIVNEENLRREIVCKALNRAKRFDRSVFMEKIVETVDKIAS